MTDAGYTRLQLQKELLAKILFTTHDQPSLMESEDTVGLMDNLEERQLLLDQLAMQELTPQALKQARTLYPDLVGDIEKLLKAIQLQDQKNEAIAHEKMAELRGKLKNLQAGKKMVRYEGLTINPGATYINRKG